MGRCTFTDARRFFSYRRDKRSGRMALVAWLRSSEREACRLDPL
jgi:copper oxidase (laccase) domain-containing protein